MPLSRSAIFAGKALGVLGFLLAIAALVIPIAALLFALDLTVVGPGLVCVALCAAPGLAASGTLFGAMTVRTQARDLLRAERAELTFLPAPPALHSAGAGERTGVLVAGGKARGRGVAGAGEGQ